MNYQLQGTFTKLKQLLFKTLHKMRKNYYHFMLRSISVYAIWYIQIMQFTFVSSVF